MRSATRRLPAIVTTEPASMVPSGQQPTIPPELRSWAQRTVEKIRVAAQAGRLQFLPWVDNQTDETALIRDTYPKMIREPAVKAGLLTKILNVAVQDVQVHSADKRSARSRHVASAFKAALTQARGGTRKLCMSIFLPALMRGWSVTEKVWQLREDGQYAGKWMYRDFKSKDTRHLQPAVDEFRNVLGVQAPVNNSGRIFGYEDFVIYSYLPMFENPTGMSDLRTAVRAYWIKDATWKMRGIGLTKYSGPFLKGEYADASQKAALEEALEAARGESWITVPKGLVVEAIDFTTRGSADYEAALSDCDREILMGIIGSYLSSIEGGTPNAAGNSEIHRDTAELFSWMLAAEFADIINQELAPEWTRLNFEGEEPPTVSLGAVSEGELEVALRVDKGLQEIGMKLSRRERQEYYGRAEPEDDDDVLKPPAPDPARLPGMFADDATSPVGGVPARPFRPAPGIRTSFGYRFRNRK